MADDEQLSDFLTPHIHSIGLISPGSDHNNTQSAKQKNKRTLNPDKEIHITGSDTPENSKFIDPLNEIVGGVCLEDDQEDEGLKNIDCSNGVNHIPKLVFLGSDEDLSQANDDENSDLFQRDINNLELKLSNENELNEVAKYSGNDETNLQSSYSKSSLHSTDSELLIDHNPVDDTEDIERFIIENEMTDDNLSKLLKWHCHDPTTFLLPDKMARNQLIAVSSLCFLFMVGEAVGGALSNSLALYTDVLHLGSDLISFLISLLAIYLARKPATKKMSFGFHRAEVLGALFSVFIIWSVTGVLVYMAIERIIHEHYKDVKPDEMLITASLGVIFNIIMGFVLHSEMCCGSKGRSFGHNHSHGSHSHGSHSHSSHSHNSNSVNHRTDSSAHLQIAESDMQPLLEDSIDVEGGHKEGPHLPHQKNINVRAAFIHVIGDIIQSCGVLIAALIIKLKPEEKYRLADPICTFLFSILVLFTTVTVLRDTLHVIMEGVPRDLDYHRVQDCLESVKGVKSVHGLTVWCLTLEKNALAVHLAADPLVNHKMVLHDASEALRKNFDFIQTTIQVEDYKNDIMTRCNSCKELKN